MKRDGDVYRRAICGTVIEVLKGKVPVTTMLPGGGLVDVRVVSVEDREVQRCIYDPKAV